MKVNTWKVVNANDEVIKVFVCETREQAFEKLKFNFPKNYMFVQLKKGKAREL